MGRLRQCRGTTFITPPSIFGIDRRIACANTKCHFGWICTVATSGLGAVKLSGSLKVYGSFGVNTAWIIIMIANPKMSFTVK